MNLIKEELRHQLRSEQEGFQSQRSKSHEAKKTLRIPSRGLSFARAAPVYRTVHGIAKHCIENDIDHDVRDAPLQPLAEQMVARMQGCGPAFGRASTSA